MPALPATLPATEGCPMRKLRWCVPAPAGVVLKGAAAACVLYLHGSRAAHLICTEQSRFWLPCASFFFWWADCLPGESVIELAGSIAAGPAATAPSGLLVVAAAALLLPFQTAGVCQGKEGWLGDLPAPLNALSVGHTPPTSLPILPDLAHRTTGTPTAERCHAP